MGQLAKRMKRKTSIRSEQNYEISLDKGEILDIMRKSGYDIPSDENSINVEFRVPGGADWSNCDVDIDSENPIKVRWKEITHE